MDQNNFNEQKETIVTTDYTVKQEESTGAPVRDPKIDSYAASGFGKTLASVIMSWFPITSLIAIFLGAFGLRAVNKARELAESCGVSAGGKTIAGRIMGLIGLISGIFMSVIWGLYIILIVVAIATF